MTPTATTWRTLLADGRHRLGNSVDARRIAEEVSGHGWAQLQLQLDDVVTPSVRTAHDAMVGRRAGGEPLQYVLGRWGFRNLELQVDQRALIPRPETETLVEVALGELTRLGPSRPVVVDLGTGSGAIACALASELPDVEVWATDVSVEALALADDNRRRLSRQVASRIHMVWGSWWEALPLALHQRLDLVVSNPPYVAVGEDLPDEVARWEPPTALFAGPEGMQAITEILSEARQWLRRPGAVVVEVAAPRAQQAADLADKAGFVDVALHRDLAGRPRVLVGRV